MEAVPRPRLDSKVPLYDGVTDLAGLLDREGQDLWADNLRACLGGASAGQVFADLGLELHRLRHSVAARRLRLDGRLDELIATVEAAVGRPNYEHIPLYCAVKDLVDHLRLEGGMRWVRRLEHVATDPDASDTARVRAVGATLDEMGPGAPGLPAGSGPRVAAARQRLDRVRDVGGAGRALVAALRSVG